MGALKDLYRLVRKNEVLSLSVVGSVVGLSLLLYGSYLIMFKNPKPETSNLARVHEINEEIKNSDPSFEYYLNKIRAEKDSLESLATFPEEEEQFASLLEKKRKKQSNLFFYGLFFGGACLFITYREIDQKEKKEKLERKMD